MVETKETSNKLLLDLTTGRFGMVELARQWLTVLQKSDESKEMNASELVKKALEDVVSGRVSAEDVAKASEKLKSPAGEEEEEAAEHAHEAGEEEPNEKAKAKK